MQVLIADDSNRSRPGKTIVVQAHPTLLVAELKERLMMKTGVPANEQRLFTQTGKTLENDLSLRDYGIHDGSTLGLFYPYSEFCGFSRTSLSPFSSLLNESEYGSLSYILHFLPLRILIRFSSISRFLRTVVQVALSLRKEFTLGELIPLNISLNKYLIRAGLVSSGQDPPSLEEFEVLFGYSSFVLGYVTHDEKIIGVVEPLLSLCGCLLSLHRVQVIRGKSEEERMQYKDPDQPSFHCHRRSTPTVTCSSSALYVLSCDTLSNTNSDFLTICWCVREACYIQESTLYRRGHTVVAHEKAVRGGAYSGVVIPYSFSVGAKLETLLVEFQRRDAKNGLLLLKHGQHDRLPAIRRMANPEPMNFWITHRIDILREETLHNGNQLLFSKYAFCSLMCRLFTNGVDDFFLDCFAEFLMSSKSLAYLWFLLDEKELFRLLTLCQERKKVFILLISLLHTGYDIQTYLKKWLNGIRVRALLRSRFYASRDLTGKISFLKHVHDMIRWIVQEWDADAFVGRSTSLLFDFCCSCSKIDYVVSNCGGTPRPPRRLSQQADHSAVYSQMVDSLISLHANTEIRGCFVGQIERLCQEKEECGFSVPVTFQYPILSRLLVHGADLNEVGENGTCSIEIALESEHYRLLEWLFKQDYSILGQISIQVLACLREERSRIPEFLSNTHTTQMLLMLPLADTTVTTDIDGRVLRIWKKMKSMREDETGEEESDGEQAVGKLGGNDRSAGDLSQ